MSIEREVSLDNLADYTSLIKIKLMLNNLDNLNAMAHNGNQTAHCILMDLKMVLINEKLTNRQQECLRMRYVEKETNVYIAEQLNITESGVRKNLEGGLKRVRKILLGQI